MIDLANIIPEISFVLVFDKLSSIFKKIWYNNDGRKEIMREKILEFVLEQTIRIDRELEKASAQEVHISESMDRIENWMIERGEALARLGTTPLPFQTEREKSLYDEVKEWELKVFSKYERLLRLIDKESEDMYTGKKAMNGYLTQTEELRKLRDFSGRG